MKNYLDFCDEYRKVHGQEPPDGLYAALLEKRDDDTKRVLIAILGAALVIGSLVATWPMLWK